MTARGKPSVLCAINYRGWCFESHAIHIARLLDSQFKVEMALAKELEGTSGTAADILLAFNWPSLATIDTNRFRFVIACLCDHWSIPAYQSPQFFDLIREKADAVAVFNQELQRRIAPYLDIPVFLTEPGADCELFRPQPFPKSIIFGWCGSSEFAPPWARIADGKGVKIIEHAARLSGAELLILDSFSETQLSMGRMPEDFYGQISVYVCASISEGTPNPILESLACGRPVITTDVGVVPRTIQNGINGLIVQRDARSVATAMEQFLVRNLQPERMSPACRRAGLEYDWKIKIAAWAHCFHSVLEQ